MTLQKYLTATLLALTLTFPTFAAPAPTTSATFTNRLTNSLRHRAGQTRFRHLVPAAKLGKTTWQGVLKTVQEGTGLQLTIDWTALEAAGLNPALPLTIEGKQLSYDAYLAAACAQSEVSLILSFQEPAGTFTLTTRDTGPAIEAPAVSKHESSPADKTTQRKLDEIVKELSADQMGLERVINFLRDQTNCNIEVKWDALQAAGIDKTTPISVNLKNVSLARALRSTLENAGGGAANLSFTIDDGVVIVTTRDDLASAKYRTVRVYNIRRYLTAPNTRGLTYDDRERELADTIKSVVTPESWTDNGGIGSLRIVGHNLIVNQTRDNQEALAALLQKLHATSKTTH
jgi:hypothetical protein